jgi:glycosyltransferase involved in cell wall biosynthesis
VRIAIDASTFGSRRGGEENYLASILSGLGEMADPADRFPLLVRRGGFLPEPIVGHQLFPIAGYVSRSGLVRFSIGLERELAHAWPVPEIVVSITHTTLRAAVPRALIVGDLCFHHHPDLYPPPVRARLRNLVPRQARAARAVITPSAFTRRDVIEHLGVDPQRVFVVPPACGHSTAPADREDPALQMWAQKSGARDPFLLYVGDLHPRENVVRLIHAFGQVMAADPELRHCRLIVAGRFSWKGQEERGAAYHAPPGAVVFLGQVTDDQRGYLLRHATAVAYPAIFEGSGLPVVEAMAAGAAVLTSDRTALPQVAGDACLLVDPFDVVDIAKGVRRLLTEAALRAELRERGLQRAQCFTTKATGDAAMAALQAALALASPARRGRAAR